MTPKKEHGSVPHYFSRWKSSAGFTLIELLVVISIIILLSSVAVSYADRARSDTRDTKRVQDLSQVRTALELYYNDHGRYPAADTQGPVITQCVYSGNAVGFLEHWSELETVLTPYLRELPADPLRRNVGPWTTGGYSYAYCSNPTDNQVYDLVGQTEDASNPIRCEVKCQQGDYNTANPDRPWCTSCPNGLVNSPYLFDLGPDF